MKGFYIYEESLNQLRKEATVACFKLGDISHIFNTKLEPNAMVSAEVEITASVGNTITKATTNEDDTYDFETGALIALMKMCGVEKVVRAFNEVFPKERYNTYVAKLEGKLHELKKDFDKLGDRNKYLIEDINKKLEYIKEKDEENKRLEASNCAKGILNGKLLKDYNTAQNAYEVMVEKSADLMDKVKKLEEENEKLQHDYNLCLNSENALKYTVDSLNKSVDKLNKAIEGYKNDLYNTAKRCKELERAYKASNDDEAKLVEYYQREIKKFEEENEKLKGIIDELFESEQHTKTELGRLYFEKHRLEEENEKLKLDCEKLQHGYNDMIFCGGRQNGKQYTFLVDLFKKIDQKKVDAAYKEAYNTTLPVWQKEVFNHINQLTVDSLIEQSRAFTRKCVDEWLYKPPTKREEMWDKIFELHKESDVIIKVKKEDVDTFLHELENKNPEITWLSTVKLFETKYTIKNIYEELKTCDVIYFRLSYLNTLSYSSDSHIYPYRGLKCIDYLPPMRWDLFKKGRLAVKVDYDNYKEFYEACEKELGKRPVTAVFTEDFTVSICKKDGLFEIFTVEDQKKTGRKIVDWEDVR